VGGRRLGFLCLIGGFLCAGCSIQYTDDEGQFHTIGLVHQVVAISGDQSSGTAVRTETLGVSVVGAFETTSFGLGYNATSFAAFRDDACYVEDVNGPLSEILRGTDE
jgi:hypothetical protein